MSVVRFIPRPDARGREFTCAICAVPIVSFIAIDHFPICTICRWCCNVEGRWGRKNDGIGASAR